MLPWTTLLATSLALFVSSLTLPSQAQLLTFSRQDLIDYMPNPFDRFPDGRPKIPDDLIERARGLSSEEVSGGVGGVEGVEQPIRRWISDSASRQDHGGARLHRAVHALAFGCRRCGGSESKSQG